MAILTAVPRIRRPLKYTLLLVLEKGFCEKHLCAQISHIYISMCRSQNKQLNKLDCRVREREERKNLRKTTEKSQVKTFPAIFALHGTFVRIF